MKEGDVMEESRTIRMMCPWIRYACDESECVCWDSTQKRCKKVLLIDAELRNL